MIGTVVIIPHHYILKTGTESDEMLISNQSTCVGLLPLQRDEPSKNKSLRENSMPIVKSIQEYTF